MTDLTSNWIQTHIDNILPDVYYWECCDLVRCFVKDYEDKRYKRSRNPTDYDKLLTFALDKAKTYDTLSKDRREFFSCFLALDFLQDYAEFCRTQQEMMNLRTKLDRKEDKLVRHMYDCIRAELQKQTDTTTNTRNI